MSIDLIKEVRDHAPIDLTPAERLLLVWIAEQARDEDRYVDGRLIAARTCFPGNEKLMAWMGLAAESTLRSVYNRLAARGLEVRVLLGTGKKGKPYYSVPGRRTTLRLPELTRRPVVGHPTTGDQPPDDGPSDIDDRSSNIDDTSSATHDPHESHHHHRDGIADADDLMAPEDARALQREVLAEVLSAHGVKDEAGLQRVIEISLSQGTTSPAARLTKDGKHRRECVGQYLNEQRSAREQEVAHEPVCRECNLPKSRCRRQDAAYPTQDRHEFAAALHSVEGKAS